MIRFILAIANDELVVNKRKRTDIEADLHRDGYDKLPSRASSTSQVRSCRRTVPTKAMPLEM